MTKVTHHKEKAAEIVYRIGNIGNRQDIAEVQAKQVEDIVSLIQEAEARGIERAAEVSGGQRWVTTPEALQDASVRLRHRAHNDACTLIQKKIRALKDKEQGR